MKSPSAVMRELINEHITPDEERARNTWWAEHPQDVADNKMLLDAQRVLLAEIQHLADIGADPSSSDVKRLLAQHNELLRRYKARERAARQLAWNPSVTIKWYGPAPVGSRAVYCRNKGIELGNGTGYDYR
jgi:hypothetical protein